jgi:hypothetical protein
MQNEVVLAHVKEEAEKLKKYFIQLENEQHLTAVEAEQMLEHIEKIYRNLCVYTHSLKTHELTGDLQVHMKIMQTVSGMENNVAAEKIIEPVSEIKEEEKTAPLSDSAILRKIELSINNKFRIANELFNQNQLEFNAAFQQLNSMNTSEEAMRYLESLRQVYKWKDENPLVKNFYALVQKRFS